MRRENSTEYLEVYIFSDLGKCHFRSDMEKKNPTNKTTQTIPGPKNLSSLLKMQDSTEKNYLCDQCSFFVFFPLDRFFQILKVSLG